jgi:hypothetical protein
MDNFPYFDWRIHGVTRITADWGKHKKGTPIRPTIRIKNKSGEFTRFEPPKLQSLSFNLAINAANEAEKLKSKFSFYQMANGIKKVSENDLEILYNYFEYCMITVAFSYQALETLANYIIEKKLEGSYPLKRMKHGKEEIQYLEKKELQRKVSTDEKLSTILPEILHIKSPRHTKIWESYKNLKKIRDAAIHAKPYGFNDTEDDKNSIFFLLYYCNPKKIVINTLELAEFFTTVIDEKRWSDKVKTVMNSTEQKDRYYDY